MNLHLTLATAQRVLAQIRHDHRTMALLVGRPLAPDDAAVVDLRGRTDLRPDRRPAAGHLPADDHVPDHVRDDPARADVRDARAADDHADPAGGLRGRLRARAGLRRPDPDQPSWRPTRSSVLGLQVAGPEWMLVGVSVLSAILGVTMGLASSSLARTEFQAVQFMPALIFPQFLLCGLLVPRELMPPAAEFISDLPAAELRRGRGQGGGEVPRTRPSGTRSRSSACSSSGCSPSGSRPCAPVGVASASCTPGGRSAPRTRWATSGRRPAAGRPAGRRGGTAAAQRPGGRGRS